MSPAYPRGRRPGPPPADGRQQHLGWLSMVEVTGPFLTLPVLRRVWPTLDALDKEARDGLRAAHTRWQADPAASQAWVEFVLGELLGWDDALETNPQELARLAVRVQEDEADLVPSFALVEPGEAVKPDTCRLVGMVYPPGVTPTARIKGDEWAATPVDRLAQLCRAVGVELGLVTDGRWWSLVWAPRGGVTTAATFDAVSWPELADRDVVRAFRSLLGRQRFFGVPDEETLVPLLRASLDNQEEVTEALGAQVRRAVELLVDAIGRADSHARDRGEAGIGDTPAQEVYRGAVAVMMRVVFLLFAEERGLLPADNDLYAQAYSAGRLCDSLEQQALQASEDDLEHSSAGWLRLLALFQAVHSGVSHPRLRLPAYDGSIFDPDVFGWLARLRVDDRTVLHMLRAVQYVVIGRERRRLSFRTLDVEQIGYVYEGLLSFEGRRAADTVVGLIGKQGLEEEVPLAELEAHAAAAPSVAALAARLAETYKDSRIGTVAALTRLLAPMNDTDRAEALRLLLAATGGDLALAQRVLPFVRLLRRDLRGLPVVINRDALYVTESPLRKNTGTHYTPRHLAKQIVEGALQPLVYAPGPLQTADDTAWKPRPSAEILALKVADIAMGSGAFLVAACRYLADRLVKAWSREGNSEAAQLLNTERGDAVIDADAEPLVIKARRQVIEHCLYGGDINEMAVEMAKLSLWLVSMDPQHPFTFLDDRLVTGDSLLGITSIGQLEVMHLDPAKGRALHTGTAADFTVGVRTLVDEVAAARRELAGLPGETLADLGEKRRRLHQIEEQTRQARLFADLTVGAALASAGRGDRALPDNALAAANFARLVTAGRPDAEADAADQARRWLATDLPRGGFARQPLHWPLAFPEVFEAGGFDAIVGNPPFLGGQKITGALGDAYREQLVEWIGRGARGSADLVAYFVLRAHEILNECGQTGLIATNTLAQGDTRQVGLDQLAADAVEIRAAVKSAVWPSRFVALHYCAIWTSRTKVPPEVPRVLDEHSVTRITPSLDPASRITRLAERLVANQNVSFIGSYVLGLGFAMSPEEAHALIAKDPRNAEVLFPYLNGEDLNQRPDCSGRRWVINFHDWPLERAATYPDCFDQVVQLVKPERARNNDKRRREIWWRFTRPAPELYRAIAGLAHVIAIARVSKATMPALVPTGQVMNEQLVIFATDDPAMLALLSSAPHYWWAISRGSTMKGDLRYTPSDVFETFPRPKLTADLRSLGERLDSYRRDAVMLPRQAGLTATYNLVHSPDCDDADIEELRRIHVAIDHQVMRAYGWGDLELGHGFHETRQGTRYTVGPGGPAGDPGPAAGAEPPAVRGGEGGRPARQEEGEARGTGGPVLMGEPDPVLDVPQQFAAGSSYDVRDALADFVARDLLGPWDGPAEQFAPRARGPRERYLVGMLGPKHNPRSPVDAADEVPETHLAGDADSDDGELPEALTVQNAGRMWASSMGLSFAVPTTVDSLAVTASWGHYTKVVTVTEEEIRRSVWLRTPVEHPLTVRLDAGPTRRIPLANPGPDDDAAPDAAGAHSPTDATDVGVFLAVEVRDCPSPTGVVERVVELALVNAQLEPAVNKDAAWLYQPRLVVCAVDGETEVFLPVDDPLADTDEHGVDPEDQHLRLLYRNQLRHATGRNVAVHAEVRDGARRAWRLSTTWLPVFDVPATIAPPVQSSPHLAGLVLSMDALAELAAHDLAEALAPLSVGYAAWLAEREAEVDAVPVGLRAAARRALRRAGEVARRIGAGIELLRGGGQAWDAFRFANRAMALQRRHTAIAALREAEGLSYAQAKARVDAQGPAAASWRPFQLAFVLLNLPALTDPAHRDRRGGDGGALVDLLFFPTGGGKTEAYLGLAAYTFAIRRLQGVVGAGVHARDGGDGVAVLMRYTLRLLTAQQFQRAAALVCAAEVLRRQAPDGRFGATPFRIGLWVGVSVAPNWYDDAARQIADARTAGRGQRVNVLQTLLCPWCGERLRAERDLHPSDAERRVRLFCARGEGSDACPFSRRATPAEGLPILTVDEELYRYTPSLVIATVDKLAQLPWFGFAGALFGRVRQRCPRHGYRHPDLDERTGCRDRHLKADRLDAVKSEPVVRLRPPDLVIQDELHLISGALGTTVGLFEAAVDELCGWEVPAPGGAVRAGPVIVASTATTKRAEAQVRHLYGRRLSVFPPQVLDVADTFFSRQVPVTPATPGRRYLGLCAHGVRLKAAEIRLAEILLLAGQTLFDRYGQPADPYMTVVGYFNATRELAGMRRYLDDDVTTRVRRNGRRRGIANRIHSRTGLLNVTELTSRISSGEIAEVLKTLEYGFEPDLDTSIRRAAIAAEVKAAGSEKRERRLPTRPGRMPADVVLATSMLQVGVDVARFGLMVVTGQPKNTAEYIQASSRVGRSAERPGLVVTVYNWARPRDLAHFEDFEHYHATFYRQVEALSLTPYARRALDRGTAATVIAALRHADDGYSTNAGAGRVDLDGPIVRAVTGRLLARAEAAGDERGRDYLAERLGRLRDCWSERQHGDYALGYVAKHHAQRTYVGLLDPAGDGPWGDLTVPRSMRETENEVNLLVPGGDLTELSLGAPAWTFSPAETEPSEAAAGEEDGGGDELGDPSAPAVAS